MTKILHIETATPICSVALSIDNELIALKEINEFNSHSEVLTCFIDEISKENNIPLSSLDAIAISNGPGSYTGLRIGASTAKGLGYALNIPIIAIDTIEALAFELKKRNQVTQIKAPLYCPMIDARRMEVYTAFYDETFKCIYPLSPFIIDEHNLLSFLDKYKLIIGGNGAQKCFDIYNTHSNIHLDQNLSCSSKYLIDLALKKYKSNDFVDVAYFEPNYLKEFIGK